MNKSIQRGLVLFLVTLQTILVTAQNQVKLDSLKTLLETNLHDTTRLHVLHDLAVIYSDFDSAQTHQYYEKVKVLSEALGETDELLYVQFNYGWLLINMGHYTQAENMLMKGLQLARQTNNSNQIAKMFQGLGRLERILGNYEKATDYYLQYRSVSEDLNDAKQILLANQGLGIITFLQGNYSEASTYFQKSLAISIEANEGRDIANNYTNLGNVFHYQGNYPKALDYFLKALKYHEKQGDKHNIGYSLENIGNLYRDQKDYTQALVYLKKSLELKKELKYKTDIALTLINIGYVYQLQKEYTQALQHYYQVLAISKQLDNRRFIAQSIRGIGEIQLLTDSLSQAEKNLESARELFEELGEQEYLANLKIQLGDLYSKKGNYKEAIAHLEESIQFSSKNKDKDLLRDATGKLAQIHGETGDYKAAYEKHVLFKQLSDSLLNEDNTKKITQQAMQFDFDKEKAVIELENQQQQLEKERQLKEQRYILIGTSGGLFFMFLLAVISYRSYRNKQRANQLLSEQNEEIKSQSEEIQVQAEHLSEANLQLKKLDSFKEDMTGMLVHDLKNPLNTIVHSVKDYTPENSQKIKQASIQLHNMVLNMLDVYKYENSQMLVEQSEVSLSDVAATALDDTSQLLKNKSIALTNTIDTGIQVKADQEILLRVFANLLTNAIKYTPQYGTIALSSEVVTSEDGKEEMVSVRITDSGKGIEAEHLDTIFNKFTQIEAKKSGGMRSTGLGLTFCKMAIEAHKGEIRAESEVGKGTTFIFTLPLARVSQTEVAQPAPEKPAVDSTVSLNSAEKEALIPIIAKLSQTLVFEVGKVKSILKEIQQPTEQIKKWENEVNKSILSLNEKEYQHLIDIATYA